MQFIKLLLISTILVSCNNETNIEPLTIYTSRPGFVIGKKGADIEKIKSNITKITDGDVTVNIKEIKKPEKAWI